MGQHHARGARASVSSFYHELEHGLKLTAMWRALCWIGLGVISAGRLAAQSVELRVIEENTQSPLPGVVIRLLRDGRAAVAGLTNEAGRLVLRAPEAGTYHLRADRIGHEGFGPEAIRLEAGTAVQRTVVMPQAIRLLPAIVVTTDTRCQKSHAGGSLAAALWQEIQTALVANQVTSEQRLQVLRATRFERELSPTRGLLQERVVSSRFTSGQPFVALPAQQLAQRGFVYREADTLHYAAPDAALLLAEEFVKSHCFKVNQEGGDPSLLGLSFEPAGRPDHPDVRGTLWIDRASRELRFLDYTYTELEPPDGLGDPGGRIDFERLPAGTWIVRYWAIRMPRVGARSGSQGLPGSDQRYLLLGWIEHGGRAESVRWGGAAATGTVVEGVVIDQLHQAPLPGAVVTIDGESDSTRTDAAGTFRLTPSQPGTRILRVTHPLLGIVADSSTQEVVLRVGQSTTTSVSVPPIGRFVKALCGTTAGTTVVLGMVRDSAGSPVDRVRVRAAWYSVFHLRGARIQSETTVSGPRGIFTFCNLPPTWSMRIDFPDGTDTSVAEINATLGWGEYRWLDLVWRR